MIIPAPPLRGSSSPHRWQEKTTRLCSASPRNRKKAVLVARLVGVVTMGLAGRAIPNPGAQAVARTDKATDAGLGGVAGSQHEVVIIVEFGRQNGIFGRIGELLWGRGPGWDRRALEIQGILNCGGFHAGSGSRRRSVDGCWILILQSRNGWRSFPLLRNSGRP